MSNISKSLLAVPFAAVVLGLSAVAPAQAQLVGGGLVTVNVSNVANNIARDLDVNVSQIPVTVQVPVGVAANVCDVAANVLAAQRRTGDATCTATSTSTALSRFTQRQLVEQ